MVADIERALKYPLNFKPLFILGIIFVIALIVAIIPLFLISQRIENAGAALENSIPFLVMYILSLLTAMVIISVSLSGYMISVSRSIIAGNLEKAPELAGIHGLFIDGLKFMVIAFVYAIPPIIMAVFAVIIFNILGIILMLFLIPLFYVAQLAGAHLAYTNSLEKALDIPYIYSMVFGNPKGFTLGLIFWFVAVMVYSFAGMFIVTYPFIIVASYVVGQYIFTIFYMESTGLIEENKL